MLCIKINNNSSLNISTGGLRLYFDGSTKILAYGDWASLLPWIEALDTSLGLLRFCSSVEQD